MISSRPWRPAAGLCRPRSFPLAAVVGIVWPHRDRLRATLDRPPALPRLSGPHGALAGSAPRAEGAPRAHPRLSPSSPASPFSGPVELRCSHQRIPPSRSRRGAASRIPVRSREARKAVCSNASSGNDRPARIRVATPASQAPSPEPGPGSRSPARSAPGTSPPVSAGQGRRSCLGNLVRLGIFGRQRGAMNVAGGGS